MELYSHVPVMRTLVENLQTWGLKIGGCYLIDATYAADPTKFISGSLLSLSAMIQLELPHLNVSALLLLLSLALSYYSYLTCSLLLFLLLLS